MTSVTDVVVIGGGQSGLAAARALAARGISPVVLEAGPADIRTGAQVTAVEAGGEAGFSDYDSAVWPVR